MTELNEGPDRWIRSVDVVAGEAETLYVVEDQDDDGLYETTAGVTVAEGEYWGHGDASFGTTLAGLYDAYADALNNASALGNQYVFAPQTPTGSQVKNSGIELQRTSGGYSFQIDWGQSDVPPEWFGWPADEIGKSYSSSGSIQSPYSPITYWQPWPLFESGKRASEKEYDESAMLYQSHDDEQHAFQTQHGEITATRRFRYEWLAAAHVRDGKGLDATHASNAGLPTGDRFNAYYHLWSRARTKSQIVVIHSDGDQNLSVDGHRYERGYLIPSAARSQFSQAIEHARDGGEFSHLELKLLILGGNVDIK